jgi:hypothetical protein
MSHSEGGMLPIKGRKCQVATSTHCQEKVLLHFIVGDKIWQTQICHTFMANLPLVAIGDRVAHPCYRGLL